MTASTGQLTPAQLSTVALFTGLMEDQLTWLARKGQLLTLSHGAVLFDDGEPARQMYIVLAGELLVTKVIDDCDEILARHCAQKSAVGPGLAWPCTGEIALLTGGCHEGRATAVGSADLLAFDQPTLLDVLARCPQILRALLPTMAAQLRTREEIAFRRVALSRVNALTAGFAHELNNQMAAIESATRQLHVAIGELTAAAVRWGGRSSESEQQALADVIGRLREAPARPRRGPEASPLDEAEREEGLAKWLAAHGAGDNSYEMAGILGEPGLDVSLLEDIRAGVEPGPLPDAVSLLAAHVQAETLADELASAGSRIEDFTRSTVAYANMDGAARRAFQLADGIEATLTVLAAQLSGIRVERDYADLPAVMGYPAELNEVWTNLVGYLVGPMQGDGVLSIVLRLDGTSAVVEMADGERPYRPVLGDEANRCLHDCHHIVSVRHRGSLDADLGTGQRKFVVRLPTLTGSGT